MKKVQKPNSCPVKVAMAISECTFYEIDEELWECEIHGEEVCGPDDPNFCREARNKAKVLKP